MKRRTIEMMSREELVIVLDREFSHYIRMKAANDKGIVQCITCGAFHIWDDRIIDNGHFITREEEVIRFNEINCNPQCKHCNNHKHGRHHIYRDRLIEKHGKEAVEHIEQLARMGGKYGEMDLVAMIKDYRQKNKDLKQEKGL